MRKRKIQIREFMAVFSPEEEGGYSVSVPDLPGCHSQGETFEEAQANITEAIQLYLEDVDEDLYQLILDESNHKFVAPISVRLHA